MRDEEPSYFARFADILGQSRPIAQLEDELRAGRMHHAHLFSGPDGVGKTTTARAWASRLLCVSPDGLNACGRCPSCLKMQHGFHPDFIRVTPEGASIKIDQVREVAASTRYKPSEGRWRVIIIERAESMNEASANALLKTLEEPGGNTRFVLLSAHPNLLLATIRSRCAAIHFGPLSVEDTETVLRKFGVEEARVGPLARISRGAPGRAVALEGSVVLEERTDLLRALWKLTRGQVFDALEFGAMVAVGNDRALFEERLVVWSGLLRDVAVLSSTGRMDLVHNQDEQRGIQALADALPTSRAIEWPLALERARRRLRGNVNIRLIMESLVLELAEA